MNVWQYLHEHWFLTAFSVSFVLMMIDKAIGVIDNRSTRAAQVEMAKQQVELAKAQKGKSNE